MLLWNVATSLRMPGAGIAARWTTASYGVVEAWSGPAEVSFSPKSASTTSP